MNRVLAINAIGKSVVRADRGNVEIVIDVTGCKSLRGQLADSCTDAGAQLAGRLAGKGQAKNFVWRDVTIGDEPHHSSRHRFGLAAPRTCNDKGGLPWRLDNGDLLGSRRVLKLEDLRHIECAVNHVCRHFALLPGHSVTAFAKWMRCSYRLANSPRSSDSKSLPKNVFPAIPRAASWIRAMAASKNSGVPASCDRAV